MKRFDWFVLWLRVLPFRVLHHRQIERTRVEADIAEALAYFAKIRYPA